MLICTSPGKMYLLSLPGTFNLTRMLQSQYKLQHFGAVQYCLDKNQCFETLLCELGEKDVQPFPNCSYLEGKCWFCMLL